MCVKLRNHKKQLRFRLFTRKIQYLRNITNNHDMGTKEAIKLFEEKRVRTAWDDEQEKWYFSIVDVVQVLTDSDYQTARKYWKVLKGRIVQEAGQPVTICYQLKMRAADGKMRLTDVADTEQLFRIIQSVPSPKAEPFKRWMAQVAAERVDQMQDPELRRPSVPQIRYPNRSSWSHACCEPYR